MKIRFSIKPSMHVDGYSVTRLFSMSAVRVYSPAPNGAVKTEVIGRYEGDSVEALKDLAGRIVEAARVQPVEWEVDI